MLDNNHSSGIIKIRTIIKFLTVPDGAWFTAEHVSESVQGWYKHLLGCSRVFGWFCLCQATNVSVLLIPALLHHPPCTHCLIADQKEHSLIQHVGWSWEFQRNIFIRWPFLPDEGCSLCIYSRNKALFVDSIATITNSPKLSSSYCSFTSRKVPKINHVFDIYHDNAMLFLYLHHGNTIFFCLLLCQCHVFWIWYHVFWHLPWQCLLLIPLIIPSFCTLAVPSFWHLSSCFICTMAIAQCFLYSIVLGCGAVWFPIVRLQIRWVHYLIRSLLLYSTMAFTPWRKTCYYYLQTHNSRSISVSLLSMSWDISGLGVLRNVGRRF